MHRNHLLRRLVPIYEQSCIDYHLYYEEEHQYLAMYHMMRSTAFPENQLRTRVVDIVDIGYKIESCVGLEVLVPWGS